MSRVPSIALAATLAACPILAFGADAAVAPKPEGWKPRRPSIEARKPGKPVPLLIERLASPKFVERAEATRELAKGGLDAVAPLREAAKSDSPEISIRAVAALENLWLRALEDGDEPTADAALSALDELSVAGDPAQRGRIESLLASYESLIEKFAINEIRRLGGSVRFNESIGIVDDNGMIRPQIMYVVIGTAWSGGEAGLRHIRRARPQSGVYFIKGVKLPEGAAERFEVDSGIPTQVRGPSYLGVRSAPLLLQGVEGCLVDSAESGTPASKAGIRQGDLIVEFNGRKVTTFEQLVEEISRTKPGQVVDALIRRSELDPTAPGQARTVDVPLKITMEEWK